MNGPPVRSPGQASGAPQSPAVGPGRTPRHHPTDPNAGVSPGPLTLPAPCPAACGAPRGPRVPPLGPVGATLLRLGSSRACGRTSTPLLAPGLH